MVMWALPWDLYLSIGIPLREATPSEEGDVVSTSAH